MTELGKPNLLKIYPQFGRTAEEDHRLRHLAVPTWEPDVIRFLNENLAARV